MLRLTRGTKGNLGLYSTGFRGYSRGFKSTGRGRRILPRQRLVINQLLLTAVEDVLDDRGEDDFHRKAHFTGRDNKGVAP